MGKVLFNGKGWSDTSAAIYGRITMMFRHNTKLGENANDIRN